MNKIKKIFATLLVMFSLITSVTNAYYPSVSVASAPTEKPTTPKPIEDDDATFVF